MKNLPNVVKNAQKLLDENSPVILTGVAIVGTVATAWLTFKGTKAATEAIAEEAGKRNSVRLSGGPEPEPISNQDKFLLTWKFYAPVVGTVLGSSVAMVMATRISANRTAALAGALVIAERSSDQYRDRVKEVLGQKKHIQVVDSIAAEQVQNTPPNNSTPIQQGQQWFLDTYSGRYFQSDVETIKRKEVEFNHSLLYGKHASLTEWYNLIGLEEIEMSDELGWNKDRLLEIIHTPELYKDVTVVALTFDKRPQATFRDADI